MKQAKKTTQPVQPTQTRPRLPGWAAALLAICAVAPICYFAYRLGVDRSPPAPTLPALSRRHSELPPRNVKAVVPNPPLAKEMSESKPVADVPPAVDEPRDRSKAAPADGVVEVGIAYGTEKRNWLQWAVKEFGATKEGQRIHIHLIPMGSLESAHAIVEGDQRIHVWSPASSLYRDTFLRDWARRHRGKPIAKAEEMLALTPMVFVMWKGRFEAFTAKSPEVSLRTIYYAMQAKTGWRQIAGKPEWGLFKFGHTQPTQSNSGLMTLILLAYEHHKKFSGLMIEDAVAPEFQEFLAQFERGVTGLSNSTGNLMGEMLYKGPASFDALMVYESVAIDYLKNAQGRWEDLQIVYPQHNLWNENPYYILNTPWTTAAHQRAAEEFLKYLMSEPVQARALEHGFRPGNPEVSVKGPESPFVKYVANGLRLELPAVCQVPSPEVIASLQQVWLRNAVPR